VDKWGCGVAKLRCGVDKWLCDGLLYGSPRFESCTASLGSALKNLGAGKQRCKMFPNAAASVSAVTKDEYCLHTVDRKNKKECREKNSIKIIFPCLFIFAR
jgi:hypothetical protein